jgi:hypothetical protein
MLAALMRAVCRRPFVFPRWKGQATGRECRSGAGDLGSGRELARAATRRVERSCLARGHVSGTVTAARKQVECQCRVGQGDGGFSRRWRWSEKGESCWCSDAVEIREPDRITAQRR